MNTTRIALIEDSSLWRKLIENELHKSNGFDIVLYCEWGEAFMQQYQSHTLDLILLDISLPGSDGYSVFQQIRSLLPNIPVIVFTSSINNFDIGRFTSTDIAAYINKCRIHTLHHDLKVVMKLKQKKGYGFKTLRDDDLEILQLICRKLTNEQIGEQLHIDSKTVENRINKLCDQLGIEHKKMTIFEFCVQYGFWNTWQVEYNSL
ncbi:hypothetical protein AEM51_13240 [Bacteroidetes bacterium UKL13-3]|jgi:two-component system vancomycin resistance associated response regulator VraR|nr:hypothetical protein AEM51_13240 [Bacteroidetes bacterium UKL13-3]HCP93105.1 hypothetical protein [Bacteroidota bacterium]